MDKKDNIVIDDDWWMPDNEQWKNKFSYFNQHNPINVFEYSHTYIENQNQMIERLERIEKKLDDLIDKENENE